MRAPRQALEVIRRSSLATRLSLRSRRPTRRRLRSQTIRRRRRQIMRRVNSKPYRRDTSRHPTCRAQALLPWRPQLLEARLCCRGTGAT